MKEKEKDKLKYILLYNIEMFINIDVGKVTNIIHTFYSNDIESFMSL